MHRSGLDALVLIALCIFIAVAMKYRYPWRGTGTAHGTARVATYDDLKRERMLKPGAPVLGQTRDRTLLFLNNVVHTAVFAPTGAGKGVSLIVPWLRACIPNSCVICDPKGENYNLTADWRRAMGQEVRRLDPFEVCGPGADTFNPLEMIGDGEECVDDAQVLAEAMTIRSGQEREPHWNNQAANVLRGLLSLILSEVAEKDRNMLALRDMVTDYDLCMKCVAAMKAKGGVFARMAGVIEQLTSTEEGGHWSREGASVMSVINQHTTWMDSPAIVKSIAKSSFDARQILAGRTSIYVILPPHEMESQSRWMRLIIAALVRLIMRENAQEIR